MTAIHIHDRHSLVELRHLRPRLAPSDEDIRGRTVRDRGGAELGTIDDLLIDPVERRVRLLHVRAGGFLGLGGESAFIPVEAIARIGDGVVTVDGSSAPHDGPPAYDPTLVTGPPEPVDAYPHDYGADWPYWTAGYPYPDRSDRDH